MAAQHRAVHSDDLAGARRVGPQPVDHIGVTPVGNKTNVLAVRLVGGDEAQLGGDGAHLRLGHLAHRKAQESELCRRCGEEKITLIARVFGAGMQFGAVRAFDTADIMAGGERVGAHLPGRHQQVGEFHPLVAADARHRRFAARIGIGEIGDHFLAEAGLVIEDVMRNAQRGGDAPGVMDVLPGTASTLARRRAGIKLHGHAHRLVPGARDQRGGDRGVDAARHGNHYSHSRTAERKAIVPLMRDAAFPGRCSVRCFLPICAPI